MNTILGRKLKMSVRFDKWGRKIPVTEILAGPCLVVREKTQNKDKYHAYQIGYGIKKKPSKSQLGLVKNLPFIPQTLQEVKMNDKLNVGQIFKADIFETQDRVQVSGISKGKGFAGVVKRWGFAGGPKTHGQSDRERAPGSIGSTTTPGRVYKGKKMAGHMGMQKVTVKNLEVLEVDPEKNLIVISGSLPGPFGGLLTITKTGKVKGWTPPPLPEIQEEEDKDKEVVVNEEKEEKTEKNEAGE